MPRHSMLHYLKHIITSVAVVIIVTSVGLSAATRVTEIYVDGTDEFVEITTDGSWTGVILSGAKSLPITLPLTASGSLVFADKGLMITGDARVSTGWGWSFTDSKAVSRTLHTLSGEILQSITIATGSITAIDNTKTSLTLSGDQRIPTRESYDAVAPYIISPGQHISSATQTGSTDTGDVLTGTVTSTGSSLDCVTGSSFVISEVFLGSDELSPFVEIQVQDTIADPSLMLSGEMIAAASIILTGQRYPGDYLLVAGGYTGVISADVDALISFGSLSQTGFLSISRQSGQVLDRVSVSPVISQSQNFVGQGCSRVFDSQSVSTPGYSQAISHYFTPTVVQESDPLTCPVPVTLPPLLRIEGLRPAPPTGTPEAIALRLFDDRDVDLDRAYIVTDTGTKRYLRGPTLTESGSAILTGNFSLPNTRDACISLYSEDDRRLDRACYRIDQARTGIRHGSGAVPRSTTPPIDTPTSSTGATLTGTVEITDIIYDPPGSDTGAEQITLTNQSNQTFAPSDLRILIGDTKTKRYIKTTVGSGTTTATASFSLPNTASTCIELHRLGGLLDTSCYTITNTKTVTQSVSHNTPSHTSTRKAPITIADLVYNPPGPDTGRESITLSLPSDHTSVDLSDYRLLVGTARKKLTGILRTGDDITLTKTRGFANTRPSCATLMYDETPVDVRCRSPDTPQSTDTNNQEPQTQTGDVATLTGEIVTGAMMQTGFIQELSITDIVYDPDGLDTGREQLQLAYTGSKTLDLTDVYILINGRKKLLEGSMRPRTSKRLIGNFRLSNTKDACVQLRAQDKMRDEYCYTIQDKQTNEQENKPTQRLGTGSIISLFPNPKGSDTDRERVTAIVDGPSELRSLQINDRTTRVVPTRDPTTSKLTRRGTLSLPNRVGCVRLLYDKQVVDVFCYFSPQDGQTITTDRTQRHDLHSDAVRLLNRLTITRSGKGDQRLDCLRDGDVSIVCKTLPRSRNTTTPSERLHKEYIASIHQYMARNWSPVYYETDFTQQHKLYKKLVKAHRAGQTDIIIRGTSYPITTSREDLRAVYRIDSYYDLWMEHVDQHLPDTDTQR